jgi:hypothetical protein
MIHIHIRKVSTGEIRTYHHESEWSEFLWTDGNFGCDCNRELFFEDANDPEFENTKCSKGRFVIDKAIDVETGRVVYSETATDEGG